MKAYSEYLEEHVWTRPSYYSGFSPDGHYCIYARNRDSSILENSNYELILSELQKCAADLFDADGEPMVYDWRAGCSMVGWIEYVMVSDDAPQSLIDQAAEIVCALADYPVYSDDDYSERRHNAVCDYWTNAGMRERIELCAEQNISIFAARADIPDSVYYDLMNSEIAY